MPRVAVYQVTEAAFRPSQQTSIRDSLDAHTLHKSLAAYDLQLNDPISTVCDLRDAVVVVKKAIELSNDKVLIEDTDWLYRLQESDLWKDCEQKRMAYEERRKKIVSMLNDVNDEIRQLDPVPRDALQKIRELQHIKVDRMPLIEKRKM